MTTLLLPSEEDIRIGGSTNVVFFMCKFYKICHSINILYRHIFLAYDKCQYKISHPKQSGHLLPLQKDFLFQKEFENLLPDLSD